MIEADSNAGIPSDARLTARHRPVGDVPGRLMMSGRNLTLAQDESQWQSPPAARKPVAAADKVCVIGPDYG